MITKSYNMEKFSSSDKLIFVNINKSFEAMKSNDTASPHYRKSLKECTVKYWAVKDEKAFAATHILGCYQGKVIEVVKITNVKLANLNEYPGRKVFEGSEEKESPYIGLDLHEVFKSLANFHTKYWNL